VTVEMTSPKKCCGARTNRWVIAAAIAILIVGAILSRVIEPGVRVEKVMLTANTPALRLSPATPGPHPIALLAHGATGSKENCFRFGEALAAAGFDCYSVDQAGHGESPQPCSFWHVHGKWRWATNILLKPRELEWALGSVDVFIGHSMGSGAGEWSVNEDGFRPKLFIGVGIEVELGEHGPPVLLLAGLLEEIILTMGTWIGVTPQWRRIPPQLVLLVVIWLALAGLSRLRMPRWSLAVVTGILALGCLALRIAYPANMFLFAMLMNTLAISTLLLLPSTLNSLALLWGAPTQADFALAYLCRPQRFLVAR
jgi:pimeloyl-ACP methyl ester carboxylesterase